MSNDQTIFESNQKLCCAVEVHHCIYDRTHPQYLKKEAYDEAWLTIAHECEDTVASCKLRWRNIRTAFVRSVQGTAKKRTPNRTREYYLHEVLQFFLPHIVPIAESEKRAESDGEAGNTVENNEPEPDIESKEPKEEVKLNTSTKSNEPKEEVKTNTPTKSKESKQEVNQDVPTKSKDPKEEVTDTTPTKKDLNDDDEATTSAEETAGEEQPETQPEKSRLSPTKSKVKTFFIKDKPTKVGTFIIAKIPDVSNLNPTELETDEVVLVTPAAIEPDMPKPQFGTKMAAETLKLDDDERRFRFKRACKRGLDKTVMKALSKREHHRNQPEMKRQRRSRSIKSTSIGAETEHEKSLDKVMRQQRHREKRALSQAKEQPQIIIPSDVVETQMKFSPARETASSDEWIKDFVEAKEHSTPVLVEQPQLKDLVAVTVVDQAVQCTPTSTAGDDDFLNSLRPQLGEMNARQKLLFKNKVFESLLEVFGSAVGFPDIGDVSLNPNASTSSTFASSTTTDEMRLMRELVALVQAAKHTTSGLDDSNATATPTATVEQDGNELNGIVAELVLDTSSDTVEPQTTTPPRTTSSPIAKSTLNSNKPNVAATTAAPRPTYDIQAERQLNPANLPQHIIQRVVKIGDRGGGNLITQQGARRRIYRIYPRGSVPKSVQNGSGSVSGGAGTFIIPRALPNATLPPRVRPAQNPKNTDNVSTEFRQIKIPPGAFIWPNNGATSSLSSTSSAAATATTSSALSSIGGGGNFIAPTAGTRRTMITRSKIRIADGTEKHILRRYSICGPPGSLTTPSKIMTPSYGAAVAQRSLVGNGGGAQRNVHSPAVFQLSPTAGINNTTLTTSTKTSPTATVSAAIDTSASLPIPGFNKFLSTLAANSNNSSPSAFPVGLTSFMTTPTTPISNTQNIETGLTKSIAALHKLMGTSAATSSPSRIVYRKKPPSPAESPSSAAYRKSTWKKPPSPAEETAGTIAPDNFAAYNVKDEPLDDSF